MNHSPISIKIRYFASLRDARGLMVELKETFASSPLELYQELRVAYDFRLDPTELRVAINGEFASMSRPLRQGDELAFIPPVSGG